MISRWKDIVEDAANDKEIKELLIKQLDEHDQAKQLLYDKGFSWTGLSLLESIENLIKQLEGKNGQ